MTNRKLKKIIFKCLQENTFNEENDEIRAFRLRQVVNPLISFFLHKELIIKWRAVFALGMIVDKIAKEDMESARVVMRRLMWTLNDESGGDWLGGSGGHG